MVWRPRRGRHSKRRAEKRHAFRHDPHPLKAMSAEYASLFRPTGDVLRSARQEEPMDTIIEEQATLPVDVDAQPLVQAAVALRPMIRQYHDEIEREQRMPPALVGQLREAGFYKMVIPRSLGGLQVDTLTYLRVVERLAEGAGSVGWNLGNGGVRQPVPQDPHHTAQTQLLTQ